MRYHLLFSLTFLFLAACDPDAPNAGTEGNPCRAWGNVCDDGLTCENDTCVACGDGGMRCCTVPGGSSTCDPGYACESAFGEEGVCQDECGLPGLPCCESSIGGYCPGGSDCDEVTDTCPGEVSDPCLSGSVPYSVWVVDGSCTAYEAIFLVDSLEEAEECRQILVDNAGASDEVCAVGQAPDEAIVCRNGPILDEQIYLPNCSAAKVASCMAYLCASPECTWQTGECP